jgi:hypothetical protein
MRVYIKIDKKMSRCFLHRKSWFGMFSEWNVCQFVSHLNFEFDCLEKMISDLNKIILVMMLFYHIFLRHEHKCDSCKKRVKPAVSALNNSVKFSVQMCFRKISSVPEILFRKNPHNNRLIKLIPGVDSSTFYQILFCTKVLCIPFF